MKVLALQRESHVAYGVPSLSVAARITEVLEFMEARGELSFTAISENDECAPAGVDWCDVLILSKHSSRQAVELVKRARERGVRVVYDVDDWIFSFPRYSGGQGNNTKLGLIHELIGLSDAVTVANTTLLNKIRPIVPHAILVPNGMWVEKYVTPSCAAGEEASPPRIVFTNADFLKLQAAKDMLLTALQVFFLRHPEYVLDFYGDPFPEMFSLPFLHFTNRMPYADYMRALVSGRYQFAITPLGSSEDEEAAEFNACKNPFKYLNYGAAQVPGIYSCAPIYVDSVSDGVTGLLVSNDFDGWVDAFERLAGDRALRTNMRTAAFEDVMRNYHVSASADVLSEVISGSRR
ncbi:glycosyltransferase [Burkholderia cepacia]|uniref:glycosyltransferase n=1 Tax=Burkholderia cepacia TaxID=292 RepID=UPI00158B59C9|nr:glycosyltransferase family 1 protein [Burkholderia cepacia]MDN7900333.1 glycosyltransferase family 1 protein [Burkholderia cepacia]